MKTKLTILLLLTLVCNKIASQARIENEEQLNDFMSIPQESIYVHFNSSLLLTGEYLYYSIYCFNNETKTLSNISKVAYVELVGKDSEVVFKHKVRLENGRGNSDFFIPVSVPSGNYKLMAYTNWMKNGSVDRMFQSDINIINPYRISSSANIDDNSNTDNFQLSSTENANPQSDSGKVVLQLDANTFGNRSKVAFNLENLLRGSELPSHFSVSVRRKGNIPRPLAMNSVNFIDDLSTLNPINSRTVGPRIALPELRGELISGKVTTTNTNLSTDNLKVAVSIPGEHDIYKIAHTNSNGEFFVNIDTYYSTDNIYVQVLGENRNQFKIDLNDALPIDRSKLKFNEFRISQTWKDEILEQSVNNQIESAYFKYKPDTLIPFKTQKIFENRTPEVYVLDDYTRFSTLRETIVEIVKNVSLGRAKNGNTVFELQSFNYGTNSGILPLILIDGIAIQDHESLMSFDANNISEIAVYRDQFVMGLHVYQGAIEIKTINGINETLLINATIYKSSIFKPQSKKHYFSQVYTSENLNARIPDNRQQLLWIPELEIEENNKEISFYTSDEDGEFEIRVEGFTKEGTPISITKTFSVE